MADLDRRVFVMAAAGLAAMALGPGSACAGMSVSMGSRLRAMQAQLSALEMAGAHHDVFRQHCADAGWMEQDWFWDWYQVQPVRVAYRAALKDARSAVEAVFMTKPQTGPDEDAVMEAIDAYRQIAPSGFAVQCARDLFTPLRFQTYSHDADRRWLLNEPDEAFEKSPMPDFLLRMRAAQRASLMF
jgi:hypothetical protein